MWSDTKDALLEAVGIVGVVGVALAAFSVVILVIVLAISALDLKYFDNIPIQVLVDGHAVYEGVNGCVAVNSGGATTTVDIRGGFLCLFPKAHFTSKNVEIRGDKR